jgi:hypothetical protein
VDATRSHRSHMHFAETQGLAPRGFNYMARVLRNQVRGAAISSSAASVNLCVSEMVPSADMSQRCNRRHSRSNANGGEPRPGHSFGQANDTAGFDIKLNILLPKSLFNPFPTGRNRHNKAGFTPTGHHHLRIGISPGFAANLHLIIRRWVARRSIRN